ncbi:MAG: AraC family transcriptional regulator [Phycisphaerae bacterium]|nr:AraC family transcriptional regulator [Phycisphaerae bacterium]
MRTIHDSMPGMTQDIEILHYIRPYIRHCGNRRRLAWVMRNRCLLDYLLVYIAEGVGRFEVAGKSYDAQAGDLFWIPPGVTHEMEGFRPSMVCPYVHFDLIYRPEVSHWDFSIPEGMTDLSEFQPLMHPPMTGTPFEKLCGKITAYNNQRVGNLIDEICLEAARAQPYAFLRLSGLMMEILAEILRGRLGFPHQHDEHVPLLEKAAEYLRTHSHRDVTIEEASEVGGLSPSYFRYLFSLHYHCSPREYLARTRMRKARELMMGSNLNLSQIAAQTGFATVHSFSRTFKRLEGISPSEYRSCGQSVTRVEGRKPFVVESSTEK